MSGDRKFRPEDYEYRCGLCGFRAPFLEHRSRAVIHPDVQRNGDIWYHWAYPVGPGDPTPEPADCFYRVDTAEARAARDEAARYRIFAGMFGNIFTI